MSPKQKAAKKVVNVMDRVRDEIKQEPARFLVIERIDKPSIPVMFDLDRRIEG